MKLKLENGMVVRLRSRFVPGCSGAGSPNNTKATAVRTAVASGS